MGHGGVVTHLCGWGMKVPLLQQRDSCPNDSHTDNSFLLLLLRLT